MFHGPSCKSLSANRTNGVVILEFRDVKRGGEELVSKKKKRGSDALYASIENGRNAINRTGGFASIALTREHRRAIKYIPNLLLEGRSDF
jgi:hypothetical protein